MSEAEPDKKAHSSQLHLTLRLSSHPKLVGPSDYPTTLNSDARIKQVKEAVSKWDGQPSENGIIVVMGGRICQEHELVKELLGSSDTGVLHVTIKPSAWTMPFAAELLPVQPSTSPDDRARSGGSSAFPASTTNQPTTSSIQGGPAITTQAPTPPIFDPELAPPILPAAAAGASSLPASPELSRSPPSQFPQPNAHATSTAATMDGYPTFLSHLAQLIPLQRALLLLNLQKAHLFYTDEISHRLAKLGWAEAVLPPKAEFDQYEVDEDSGFLKWDDDGELQQVKDLLRDCGLWSVVYDVEREAYAELHDWEKQQNQQQKEEFQIVQLGGLPYMLHLPPGYDTPRPPPDLDEYRALKRAQAIHQILTTLLQLLITYQPSSAAIAYGRASLRSPPPSYGLLAPPAPHLPAAHAHAHAHLPHLGGGGVAPNPVAAALAAAAAGGERRPRAVLTMVINLEVIISILVPLFLLALKLAFLLWIFGRNASRKKRMILIGMASLWIVYEGYTMLRRRAVAVEREADRVRQERRRAVRAAAAVAGDLPPDAAPLRAAGEGGNELRRRAVGARAEPGGDGAAPRPAAGAEQPRREGTPTPARRRRPPSSRLTPRYWLNWLAAFGLAEEAREMGLIPRSVAGRPVAPPDAHARQRGPAAQARWKAWRTALTAIVLFFGTLSPEVERKRKRALEKRDRLLAERAVARQRRAELVARQQQEGAEQAQGEQRGDPVGAQGPDSPRSGTSTPGIFEAEEGPLQQLAPPQPPARVPSPLGRAQPIQPPAPVDTRAAAFTSAVSAASGSTSQVATPIAASPPRRPALDTNATYRPPEAPHSAEFPVAPPTDSTPVGRAVVSDAELFADGLGEAEQDGSFVAESETDDEEERREAREAGVEGEGEVDQIVALF